MEFTFFTLPIQYIKGVGPYLSKLLDKVGIHTLEELLYHVPNRYLDRRNITTIREAIAGSEVVVCGELMVFGEASIAKGRRKIFEAIFTDGTSFICVKWFHYYKNSFAKQFKKGNKAFLIGKVDLYHGEKQMVHPELEWLGEESDAKENLDFGKKIVSIYSSTEGLTQKALSKIIKNGLEKACPSLPETLPSKILEKYKFISYRNAFFQIHQPSIEENIENLNLQKTVAYQRLIFDEFFYLELGLALQKQNVLKESGIAILSHDHLLNDFYKTLPYQLTDAQKRVVQEISTDLSSGFPMYRLLQGDVGSGKTIIAAIAALISIQAGFQACLMAPTEILAEQHFRNIKKILEPMAISLTLIKSDLLIQEKKERMEKIASGEIQFVIGTHSLIQEELQFSNLALAIVDEQHRFGVLQRAEIKKKGKNPHLLIMTATPIPRTLALTAYGDLDLSIIDEMPKGRGEILTKLFSDKEMGKIYPFIKQEILKGRQAYFVYPLIDESETLDLKNATQMYEKLQNEIFPDLKIGLLHGQMKGVEKEKVLTDFVNHQIQILVATTVIEVGIDVPNATIMVVEHAERFGLAQLHQIRGRVGRGAEKSYCFLIAGWPRSEVAKERLKAMCQTNDGFKIAEADLNIRGPGDFLGVRQSGIPDFRIANLVRDLSILESARKEAFDWMKFDPKLEKPESKIIKAILTHRWKGRLNLAQIG